MVQNIQTIAFSYLAIMLNFQKGKNRSGMSKVKFNPEDTEKKVNYSQSFKSRDQSLLTRGTNPNINVVYNLRVILYFLQHHAFASNACLPDEVSLFQTGKSQASICTSKPLSKTAMSYTQCMKTLETKHIFSPQCPHSITGH